MLSNRSFVVRTLFALALLVAGNAASAQLVGSVMSASGRPILGAQVFTQHFYPAGGYETVNAQTDADGKFQFQYSGRVIFARKQGFVPLSYVIGANENTLNLTLQPLNEASTLSLPRCSEKYPVEDTTGSSNKDSTRGARIYGEWHKFSVSKQIKTKRYCDVDYCKYTFVYPGNGREEMLLYTGIMWTALFPNVSFFKDAGGFSERLLSTGEGAEEIRGTLTNGHKWRWMGGQRDEVSYYDVSPKAQEYFDHIIDEACMSVELSGGPRFRPVLATLPARPFGAAARR